MKVKYVLPLQLLAFSVFFCGLQILHAQKKWNVEIRPAVNFPSDVDGALHKHVGFGIEGTTRFNFTESMGAYAGWGWNLFPANNRTDFSYEENGFTYGLQFMRPAHDAKPGFFIGAGGLYNHIEIEKSDNHASADAKRRLGWQTEAGIVLDVFGKFQLKPGLRYRNLQAAGLQYFSIGTGLFF